LKAIIMPNNRAQHRSLVVLVMSCAALLAWAVALAQVESNQTESKPGESKAENVLRVCADPDNLPLSNERGEGYENKIAEHLARDLGRKLEYTYFPQRMGFVRNTLRRQDPQTQQFKCDVIIGVPKGYELTATTRPYMRSTYGLLFRHRAEFENLATAEDLLKLPREKLRSLRIGVFAQSPGADWLLRNELLDHAAFYAAQSGDPHENPVSIIGRDLEAGTIDMAIVWGPVAGFLVRNHSAFPAWRAVPFTPDKDIKFDYEISMGVRFGEKEWKATLDEWITKNEQSVHEVLAGFLVPLLDADGKVKTDFRAPARERATGVAKRIPLQLESDGTAPEQERL
jgi:quinoprotein dehydrogenase-associated probable ABC transporter substrate-binding protein